MLPPKANLTILVGEKKVLTCFGMVHVTLDTYRNSFCDQVLAGTPIVASLYEKA